jgi:hypothetical protein
MNKMRIGAFAHVCPRGGSRLLEPLPRDTGTLSTTYLAGGMARETLGVERVRKYVDPREPVAQKKHRIHGHPQ